MPRTRPAYPEEFRARAVDLLRSSGKSQKDVAHELGISSNALREWIKRSDLDAGRRSDGLTTSEREELRRLRRENKILAEERDILKKAAAFFAVRISLQSDHPFRSNPITRFGRIRSPVSECS